MGNQAKGKVSPKTDTPTVAQRHEISKPGGDPLAALRDSARQITGTKSKEAAERIIVQAATSCVWPKPTNETEHLIKGFTAIAEISPQNSLEAMLATQMIATNEAALMFMSRATAKDQTFEGCDANVMRATRLMRLYCEQLQALQKLRGKAGQQKVTVEHVHVNQGGQAIIGAVTSTAGGGKGDAGENDGNTP